MLDILGSLPLSEGRQSRTESCGEGKWEGPKGEKGEETVIEIRCMKKKIHSIYYIQQKKINKCRTRKCNLDRIENKKKTRSQ